LKRSFISLIIIFFVSQLITGQSQRKIDQQTLTWIRYYNIIPLTEKWAIHSELDNRNFVNPIHENLFVIRSQARYRINKMMEAGAGFAYFNVNTQNPKADPDYSVPEYRAQQDLTLINDVAKITFHNRFQIEERFIQKTDINGLLNEFSFALRFRYRLQSTFTMWEKENHNIKGTVSDEILFNQGKDNRKNTFDQNRFYFALRYNFNPNIGLELGYLKSFQRRSSGLDFYDRDIIRFTFYHRINRNFKN